MEKKYCTAVVLAAGKGSRMGSKTAKQYLEVGNRPVVAYALEAFQASPLIDEIILMTDEAHIGYCRRSIVDAYGFTKVSTIAAGGSERYESVWKALCTLRDGNDREDEDIRRARRNGYVLIHDGARPFVTGDIIERAYIAVKKWNACAVGMPVKDTIKLVDRDGLIEESPERRLVWQAQTPQGFHVPLILQAFERQMQAECSGVTDDAMVVQNQTGLKIHMVEGSYENIKITTPEDLEIAELFIKKKLKKVLTFVETHDKLPKLPQARATQRNT